MDKTLTRIDMPLPASDVVIAADAAKLYADTGTESAVSGTLTRDGYGRIGMRRAASKVPLWRSPGVITRPMSAIEIGSTIEAWDGTGIVTRKGSIAGWYLVGGKELRWEAAEVKRVQAPTGDTLAVAVEHIRRTR